MIWTDSVCYMIWRHNDWIEKCDLFTYTLSSKVAWVTKDKFEITGGVDDYRNERREIYQFDPEGRGSWVEVGKMKTGREAHGLSVIRYSEVAQFCDLWWVTSYKYTIILLWQVMQYYKVNKMRWWNYFSLPLIGKIFHFYFYTTR